MAELVRVEAHSGVLDPQDSVWIDDGCKKRMVHIAVRGLRRKHTIATRDVPNGVRGSGKESPACEIGAECLRVLFEHLGRVTLWDPP